MDIKEVWTEFKDRITSPYFGSFIISWTAINWRIPIVLFFYKTDDLKDGNTTYIDFIQRHSYWVNILFWPAIIALLYTFAYPWFKRFINVYIAEQTVKTDLKLLKVNDTTSVSMDKFLETKANLKKKETDLQSIINEEGKTRAENGELSTQIISLQGEIASLKQTHHDTVLEINRIDAERTNDLMVEHEQQRKAMVDDCSVRVKKAQENSSELLKSLDVDIAEKNRALDLQRGIIERHEKTQTKVEADLNAISEQLKIALDHQNSLKENADRNAQAILNLQAKLDSANNDLLLNARDTTKIVKGYRDIFIESLPLIKNVSSAVTSRGLLSVEQKTELDKVITKMNDAIGQRKHE